MMLRPPSSGVASSRMLAVPGAPVDCCRLAWLGLWFLLAPAAATANEPPVTIAGGVAPTNRQYYEWKVTNNHASPIVYIEFPQYHGDTFNAPPGWSQSWKNQRKIGGGKNAPGWVRTEAERPEAAIQTGRTAAFEMRLSREGALARSGSVTVRFTDGSETIVAGVELPCAPGFIERNIMLVALAVIFVVALAIHFRRRRQAVAAGTSPAGSGEQ